MNIIFVDTSILCCLLEIPDMYSQKDLDAIKNEVEQIMRKQNEALVLPLATIIETGNHISHISNGNVRHSIAIEFKKILRMLINDQSPWKYYGRELNKSDIDKLSDDFPNYAVRELGFGDLSIIHAYEKYIAEKPTGVQNVRIWSLDKHLQGYSIELTPVFGRN